MEDHWFIIRTSGRSTLALAKSLADGGFEVWTPIRTQTIRVPKMNVRREIKLPIMPSFLFVKARHLLDLIEITKAPSSPHKSFSLFRFVDRIPFVDDRHLEPLRQKEIEAVPKKDAPRFDRGARVRVKSGAFEGLKGRVENCKPGYALVLFTDYRRPVQIPTFLLREVEALSSATPRLKAA